MNVDAIILQFVALAVPIIFIAILSLFWRPSKKKTEQSNQIDNKLNSMEKRIKKWIQYRN